MALRRSILPSRLTGAPAPGEGAATPVQAEKPKEIQENTQPEPAVSVEAEPVVTPSVKAVAGVADSVFSAFAPAEPQAPKLVGTPFWDEPTAPAAPVEAAPEKPEAPAVSAAPVVQADIAPAAGAHVEVAEKEPETAPAVVPETTAPVEEEKAVALPENPQEGAPTVESAAPEEDAFAVKSVVEPAPVEAAPEPKPEPEEQAPVAGPVDFLEDKVFEASRPGSESTLKRRVREKRPRDFGAATVAKPLESPRETKPLTAFAANVPVDTRPLDRVNESLIATGIMAGPPEDTLTQAVPVGLAVEERPMEDSAPISAPELPKEQPAAAARETLQEITAREEPAEDAPVQEPAPVRPKAAAASSWGVPDEETDAVSGVARPAEAMPRPFLAKGEPMQDNAPARQDAWQPGEPSVGPVRPSASETASVKTSSGGSEQSLPWMESQSAAEWEIESPDNLPQTSWQQEGAVSSSEGVMEGGAPLPPPADLYHPRDVRAEPVASGAGGARWAQEPARASTLPPPELPGGRNGKVNPKASQKMSLGMALAALGAVGVVALVYMRPESSSAPNAGVRQLAQISKSASPTDGISSFVPLAAAPQASGQGNLLPAPQVSSSAKIAFADVPADQANQPIVATGKESIPADLTGKDNATFVDRFKAEMAKARAEKDGKTAETAPIAGATPGKDTPLTPEALKKELDNIRRTLADAPAPGSMKPTDVLKTAKAQMDNPAGTPAESSKTTSAMAGAMPMPANTLLPPPDTSSAGKSGGNLLPAPELYAKNPKGLPIINEPVTNQPVKVRTLSDFADADTAQANTDKVAIPANLRPRLASTEFPKLEVLSFIPGQGIIAYANGREGVLKIGENLNGWELASVSNDNAEFRSGRQSRTVTADSNGVN